ncbi:hypothetical protein PQX77_000828 [Marasmius sp. AFHP31]|nr:hypothetical protein PQX77_000828 [Marasmius sp. AFHP31]
MSGKRKPTISELLQANSTKAPIAKRVRLGNTATVTSQEASGLATSSVRGQAQPLAGPFTSGKLVVDDREGEKKEDEDDADADDDKATKSQSTRSSETLEDFEAIVGELTTWLLLHEHDPNLKLPCSCGAGERLVQCQDCQDYNISCKECWISQHRTNPWHWARVWNGSFFERSDISTLRQDFAVQLGHHGHPCPLLDKSNVVKFTVVHSNGVHGTTLSFCNCGSMERVQQLMRSRLFLSSAREPETAYTFTMLREYNIQALQGQLPAYDWILALRRLFDNAHTHLVQDPYTPFMLAVRVWRFIHDRLRYGEFFSLIPRTLPHLPAGTFVTRCPSCPDPDMNMGVNWHETPQHLRHLNMMYTTLDGNSKTRRFRKGGGKDHSLYHGQSYFDDNKAYAKFLKKAGKLKFDEPIPDCDNVKAVSKLTELAAHGMAVTGTVNHQCSHVFIMGVTDMYGSENQANVDAAFSRGYTLYAYEDKKIKYSTSHRNLVPHKQSYDAECAYAVNQLVRFASFKYLSGQREFVNHLERGIPVFHLTGHKVRTCKVIFALFYQWCNGHFTGEGAEQPWPFLNKVATFSCQAGPGHRHDLHIAYYNDHNRKKVVNLAYLTARELVVAASQLEDHMYEFQQLSWVHKDSVAVWSRQDMIPKETKGSWIDPHHRTQSEKAPTVASVLESIARADGGGVSLAIPKVGLDIETYWRKAFEAEDIRERILNSKQKPHPTQTEINTLTELRSQLIEVLNDFRERQSIVTPRLPDRFKSGQSEDVEGFILGVPSDMTDEERTSYGATQLGDQEATLRTSHAYDTINAIQSTCRKLEILLLYKNENVSTEDMRTRTGKSIQSTMDVRARQLAIYNKNRDLLIRFKKIAQGVSDDDSELPPLSAEDTKRKDISQKRRLGDSKRRDGALWTTGPRSLDKLPQIRIGLDVAKEHLELKSATKMTQREGPRVVFLCHVIISRLLTVSFSRTFWGGLYHATKKATKSNRDPAESQLPRSNSERRDAQTEKQFLKSDNEGRLWTLGARRGLNQNDTAAMDLFEENGDRISWTRHQAEVYWWMEEFERKHAEFHRMIRYFRKMEMAWEQIAENPEDPANAVEKLDANSEAHTAKVCALRARALRQATVWGDLARVAFAQFEQVSYPDFFEMDKPLYPRVDSFRKEQFQWATALDIQRADLVYGATKAGTQRSKPATERPQKTKGKHSAPT